jgi:cell division protein FtsI/penicillin-binding protein 2
MIVLAIAAWPPLLADEDLASVARGELPDGAALVLDLLDGRVILAHGGSVLDERFPAGSLLKPFTVYALLADGTPGDEVFWCGSSSVDTPSTQSCWFKPGHGNLTLTQALGQSCNAWFRQWLERHDPAPAAAFFARLRLAPPAQLAALSRPADAFCGFTTDIRPTLRELASAAACLFNGGVRLDLAGVGTGGRGRAVERLSLDRDALQAVRSGMAFSGREGTGERLSFEAGLDGALVKTGTSPHLTRDAAGAAVDPLRTDGWCLALFPAEKPRWLLLVFHPDGRGADHAAGAATALLRTLRAMEAPR